MRNPDRIKPFLYEFEQYWAKFPDLRFMQLISNFQDYIGSDGFYLEDDMFLERFKEWFEPKEIGNKVILKGAFIDRNKQEMTENDKKSVEKRISEAVNNTKKYKKE